jgi:hypothetical protein
MKYLKIRVALFLAVSISGCAQEAQSPADGQAPPEPSASRRFPIDVAGYVNFRYVNNDALEEHSFYRDYSASVFLSKTVGRWRFHSEFNAGLAPEYDSDGIHLLPRFRNLSVKLDSGFVNYNVRDWLQVQSGLLFIPTYWRTHRYQSTTLTVDEPFIDQNVFPTALKGGAVYGDKYWRDGGISYIAYGGIDQESTFQENAQVITTERTQAVGGKLTFHLPRRQFLSTFDVAIHGLHRVDRNGTPDQIYGVELQLSKSRIEILGEFVHASMDLVNGARGYIRQGYYIQPSYRLTPKMFAVVRYDRLNRDSRFPDQSSLARQLAGLVYRPTPTVSLKVEGNRYEPGGAHTAAYYGVTTSLVWFFHLP